MHKRAFIRSRNAIVSIAVSALWTGATGIFCAQAQAAPEAPTPVAAAKAGELITLNFQAADIEAVARTFATITGRNVVVDPRVKGTLTLVSEKPVSRVAAMNQFLAALRQQGYTLVETAGLYKVVPEAEVKMLSTDVMAPQGDQTALPTGNQIATQIFKLNHESANNLVPVLRPLISPNNTINANPGTNSLVITDYGDNLRRLARIIAAMDVANATDVEVITLKHAIASDLAPLVLRLLGSNASGAPAGQADNGYKTTLVAEPRSNALILRAATGAVATAPAPAAPGGAGAAPQATTGGQIQADVASNSLIITAPEPQYRQLRAVIDKLDARRAQVFVESLIAEVSEDQAAEFGVQWQGALGNAGDGVIGLLGSNFGTLGKNIINLASGAAAGTVAPTRGINIGLAQRTNGVYVLGFLARALQDSGNGNVLSTPNLLTLDNEEAKIVIGQNVPFVTGQFTNTGNNTSGSVNPFQTIERKDVGLTLKVKPQISENGTVRLAIYQEVSSVLASTLNSANGPTTNKRTIESNVLVDDGAIVVLGGFCRMNTPATPKKCLAWPTCHCLATCSRANRAHAKRPTLWCSSARWWYATCAIRSNCRWTATTS